MDKEIIFNSSFKDVILKYIEHKRSMGFSYDYNYIRKFKNFDTFIESNYSLKDIILTKKMVLNYIKHCTNHVTS